jgi:hypothetical protein
MRSNNMTLFPLVATLCFALTGCGETPPPATPAATDSPPAGQARTLSIPEVGAESGTDPHGQLVWDVPAGWAQVEPSSNMRLAQYRVPGSGGDGECVVFYFGPGQGGDALANAQRWAGQFSQPDGGDSLARMKMVDLDGGSLGLSLVEVTGTYSGGMSTGIAPATPEPGWMLLGGIAEGPDAPWFFKFTGPQATLEENRDAFVGLLLSIRQEI